MNDNHTIKRFDNEIIVTDDVEPNTLYFLPPDWAARLSKGMRLRGGNWLASVS